MIHAIKSKNEQRLAGLNQRNQAIYTQFQEAQKKRDERLPDCVLSALPRK